MLHWCAKRWKVTRESGEVLTGQTTKGHSTTTRFMHKVLFQPQKRMFTSTCYLFQFFLCVCLINIIVPEECLRDSRKRAEERWTLPVGTCTMMSMLSFPLPPSLFSFLTFFPYSVWLINIITGTLESGWEESGRLQDAALDILLYISSPNNRMFAGGKRGKRRERRDLGDGGEGGNGGEGGKEGGERRERVGRGEERQSEKSNLLTNLFFFSICAASPAVKVSSSISFLMALVLVVLFATSICFQWGLASRTCSRTSTANRMVSQISWMSQVWLMDSWALFLYYVDVKIS